METRWVQMKEESLDMTAILAGGHIISQGGLVAFPTETVYGLGGDALNPASSKKIYEAKGRPSDNPLIVHIAKIEDLNILVKKVPDSAKKLADTYWPGPLTIIFDKSSAVPYETTGGLDTVAVRFPSHPAALALIKAAGGFVSAPSANTSGRPSPTHGSHVYEDLKGKIEMILDTGEVGIGLESTIVDVTVNPPMILRPGFVTEEMLRETLGQVAVDITTKDVLNQAPKAPGMKYKHYAPEGELTIICGEAGRVKQTINRLLSEAGEKGLRTGVIGTDETIDNYRADIRKSVGSRQDEASIARSLYRILREFDEENVDVIYTESFETKGMGHAIMNRLLKAAGHKRIEV